MFTKEITSYLARINLNLCVNRGHEDDILMGMEQYLKLENAIDRFSTPSDNKSDLKLESFSARGNNKTVIVPLISDKRLNFHGDVELGTPGQKFRVVFDTGSSDFWVPSVHCTSLPCMLHKRFDPKLSPTFVDLNNRFTISYGTGEMIGKLANDRLKIGDVELHNQDFGVSIHEGPFFGKMNFDGVFGLGYPGISKSQGKQPFYRMVKDGEIDSPKFSFWIDRVVEHGKQCAEVVLGGVNPERFTGPITYAPTHDKRYWRLPLADIKLGNKSIFINANLGIVDTGTTLVVLPARDSETINKYIGAGEFNERLGVYSIDCDPRNRKTVTFSLGGVKLNIKPENYIFKLASGRCVSAFSSSQNSGDVFFVLLWKRTGNSVNRDMRAILIGKDMGSRPGVFEGVAYHI
ncbi:Vacuolar protease A [Zancudomyces culisetae]|uniref:rhizopuspepsin n=1 Tax=Zancudomyces culisetae TaxID=1213189 RepID=A0A1R1PSN9_ZANCU|nr:Vacuolar protease A [Zancudomyces culisetae]|eukprot:OMH83913.1 Vacuolar protease A [Zancudomyces culisetae]